MRRKSQTQLPVQGQAQKAAVISQQDGAGGGHPVLQEAPKRPGLKGAKQAMGLRGAEAGDQGPVAVAKVDAPKGEERGSARRKSTRANQALNGDAKDVNVRHPSTQEPRHRNHERAKQAKRPTVSPPPGLGTSAATPASHMQGVLPPCVEGC